jgi:hypothetical protein
VGHGSDPGYTSPVLNSKPDLFGIRGLDGNFAEWGESGDNLKNREYVVLGGVINGQSGKEFSLTGVRLQPWEDSAMIGFRTVLSSSK